MPADPREPSRRAILAYAAPALPLAALALPFYVVVPEFYARSVGLPIATVGAVLLAVRIFDAITDPLIGLLADRTRAGFGRRRIWVLIAAPITAGAAAMVFLPPAGAGALHLLVWAGLMSLAWTALSVPYYAWGAELSTSYAGRNRVVAARETLAVVGTVVALLAQAVIPAWWGGGPASALAGLAVLVGLALPATAWLAVAAAPEPVDRSTQRLGARDGVAQLLANRPFRRLLAAFFLNGLANGFPATLFLFYVGDRLGAADLAGPLLLVYFLCGVAGVPLWLALARRSSKHRAWSVAMLIACAAFLVAALLGPGDLGIFLAVCVITGLTLGADIMLPGSLQADVIDVDTAASGEQRSGLYLAAWGLATKLALAAAVGIAFPVLSWAGFEPASGQASETGLLTLAVLYAAVPVALKLAAIALMWRFPLDAAEQARLRAVIEARRRS
ncbi:MFS transporter [Blastochloris viridis]|uniref:Sugar transporter n=1 Tax=Blastochloris viridis TaxID=1079 RepID=A0A182D4T2_BLAVI|nr:MFS transporter [Blastochloris viridis]ALK09909.1 putative symporter YjmB [Blastochloris viridis]BAS00184.1 sugar transporter [Blastochloris viridis]